MKAFLKKLFKDVSGNVLLVGGAGSVALIGGAGLAVDTVEWYLWKRQLQQAVDSAALAGGNALSQGSDWQRFAKKELKRNANTTYNIVGLNSAPKTGGFTGDSGAVEVIASTQKVLPFSSLFITIAPTIQARAVATSVSDGEFCIYTLAPGGTGIKVAGTHTDIDLGCGVNSNARSPASIDFEGGAQLHGSPVAAAGAVLFSDGNLDEGTLVQPYGVVQKDPLKDAYSMDDLPTMGCDETNYRVKPSEDLDLYAHHTSFRRGHYKLCNNVTVQGELTLHPGVYIIDGGSFKVNSGAVLNGAGVTFVLTGGATIDFSGGATINLRAPTADDDPSFIADDWYGMLFFQDPDDPFSSSKVTGNTSSSFEGIVYMPKSDLAYSGNADMDSQCMMLVTFRLTVSGTGNIDNDCSTEMTEFDTSAQIVRVVE